jgi:uncharacterized membrane protein
MTTSLPAGFTTIAIIVFVFFFCVTLILGFGIMWFCERRKSKADG